MPENTSPTPKKVSTTNTKNEILKAYNDLLHQVKEEKAPEPRKEMEIKKREETLGEATGQSEEKIIHQIASLKLTLNTSLDNIEDQLNSSYKKLQKTLDALRIGEERLKELYQINAEADSLAALIAAQKEKKAEFERFMIEERSKWDKGQKELSALRKEEEDALKKNRKREEEEYIYSIQQKRKIETDQYEEKKSRLEREMNEKKQTFENEIRNREQAVAESEKELRNLQKQVEGFPETLRKAIENAVKEAEDVLTREFNHKKELETREHAGEISLKNQTIENLQGRIKDLEIQLKQAASKVDSAEQNIKQITIKAIESSALARNAGERRERQAGDSPEQRT